MEQPTVDIREHFGMPEGINDERVVVVPSQGGPRLVKSRLTRVARETKAVKDAYNNEVKKVKDRFKEDKNQVIKFVKQPDAFQKRVLIPEDLLEVARAVF
jgi:superfamily I DNA and/or RNA helicase